MFLACLGKIQECISPASVFYSILFQCICHMTKSGTGVKRIAHASRRCRTAGNMLANKISQDLTRFKPWLACEAEIQSVTSARQ